MIRIEMTGWRSVQATCAWGIDMLLAQLPRGFSDRAQAHQAYVFANRRADRLKVLVYDGVGMWLCTRRLQAGGFAWPRDAASVFELTREQFGWLVAGLLWQRLSAAQPQRITVN